MAESTSTNQAQDVIRCMHCNLSEAEYRCVPCGDRMCQNCKRLHSLDAYFASHEVVSIRENSSLDQKCQDHPSFRIESGCDDCKVPICAECKIKTHRNHKYISNDDLFDDKRKFLLKHVKKMKEKENKVESFLANTKQNKSKIYEDVRKAMKKQVDLCKRYADALLRESIEKLDDMEKTDVSKVAEYQNMLKEKLNELKVNIETSEVALERSTPVDLILFCKYGLQVSDTKIKDTFSFTYPSFKEGDVSLTEKIFGTLTSSKVEWRPFNKARKSSTTTLMQRPKTAPTKQRKKENIEESCFLRQSLDVATTPRVQQGFKELPRCIAEFDSPYSMLFHISYCGQDQVYVSGSGKNITLLDIKGKKLKTINTAREVLGFTVAYNQMIIYSDGNAGVVEVAMDKSRKTIFTYHGADPWDICCSKSGNYLVCLIPYSSIDTTEDKCGLVVEFDKTGTIKREINCDRQNNPIYREPKFVCENTNKDVCVSDCFIRKVVVVNAFGIVRFRYGGQLDLKTCSPFSPRGIATDCRGNILVADKDNNFIHLLNQKGHFITYILTVVDGITKPWSICVDPDDRIWVAEENDTPQEVRRKAKVKVFNDLRL